MKATTTATRTLLELAWRPALLRLTLTAVLLAPLNALHAGEAPPTGKLVPTPLKLLFSGSQDLSDTWGLLHFGMTPVDVIREIDPPGFTVIGCLPVPDGAWEIFGQAITEISRGAEQNNRVATWKLIRSTTRDGMIFEAPETVYESNAAAWTNHHAMAYNPDTKEYLLLKFKVDNNGFAYSAFFSSDGKRWREHPGNPLFYDGDAMSLFWSPVLHRFVCVSKSLQPYRKHVRDHGGATPILRDDSLRDRRVLMLRSSSDGRLWEPSVSLSDVWNRHRRKEAVPTGFLTVPDANDPPDLEFYSGNAFWYHDRAYMMVLNYAASPLAPRQHGPQLDNEWWTSSDGLGWERPARGVNALQVLPEVPRLESNPLISHGMILFPRGRYLLGLPEDRISYVSARANGEFSTKPFAMPEVDLFLNAAVPATERAFAKKQAYVMAAVLDAEGKPIAGFEAGKCVIQDVDQIDLPLLWEGRSARELVGRTIRLRFYLRSASIYAVTARR